MVTLIGKAKQAISSLPDNPASATCKVILMESIEESYPRPRQILRLEKVEKEIREGIELLEEARRLLGLALEAEQKNPIAPHEGPSHTRPITLQTGDPQG